MNEYTDLDIDYGNMDDLPLSEHFEWSFLKAEEKVSEDFDYDQLDWMGV